MPKIDNKTSNEKLLKIAKADVERIKKTVQTDSSGREYLYSEDKKLFESEPDENGKTWVLGIDSSVPGYWVYCPNVTGSSSKGYELKCRTPHFVFIYQDGEKLTCRECKMDFTIKLVLPE